VIAFIEEIAISKNAKTLMIKAMDSSLNPISFYQKNGYLIIDKLNLTFEQLKPSYKGMVILTKNI
jgi:hypothetical protein